MAVYPKGNKFMASVGAGKSRLRATFPTEAEARAWETEQEGLRAGAKALAAAAPAVPTTPACWTLQEAFDHSVRHTWVIRPGTKEHRAGAPKAILNASAALAFFGPDTPTSAITGLRVMEWKVELEDDHANSGSTINKKFSALSVMLKAAADFGGLSTMPRIKRCDEGDHRVVWFTDAEEAEMLRLSLHLGLPDLHNFIAVGMDTGMRRGELLRLDLSDYSKGNLMAHAGETKSGKARAVPASVRVQGIVAERRTSGVPGTKLFPTLTTATLRTQWEMLRGLMGRSEDPFFIPHVMRHTCATRLVAEGTPLNEVQAWLGHGAITTTMRYAHLMPDALKGAVARLNSRERKAA